MVDNYVQAAHIVRSATSYPTYKRNPRVMAATACTTSRAQAFQKDFIDAAALARVARAAQQVTPLTG